MYNRYKSLLPVAFLAIGCLFTIAFAAFGAITPDVRQYLGFIALAINLLTFFYARRFYSLVLAATLIAGLFNLLDFTPVRMDVSFSFGKEGDKLISVQPFICFVLVLTYLLNFDAVNRLILTPIRRGNEIQQRKKETEIEKFKTKYSEKTTGELEKIINEKLFVPEAIEAARQLILERSSVEKQGV